MKFLKFSIVVILSTVVFSCKTSSSGIVTSKEEAQKKGIYTDKKTTTTTTKTVRPNSETNTKPTRKYKINDEEDSDYTVDKENTPYLVKQLIHAASEYEGVKYRGGGTTKQGMDCSGLVSTVFKTYDISLPRSSFDMAKVGNKVGLKEAQKGDLIFFKTNGRNVINHVGLITEIKDDEIIFIHSSVQRGVIFSSTKEPYYKKNFAQINRVL
ncbi:C40 family peptidase [Flavobacterium sp. UBA6135]|uniref:C40 family peptidase n=1 Tax=Flavobacterium sp. UBA6135 TaxID=1946553 RepID=UPI0025C62F01|nr:C40 family peptidase [Flavobacterium sp. UBA6135]